MRLGVDFGTTTTAIAIVDRGNYPIVSFVNNNDDTVDFVPSIIALDGDRLIYGFDAEDAAREGAPHLRSFKRLLSDPSVTDTSTLRLGNHSISILDALTGFLSYVVRQLRTNSSIASLPDSEPLEALVGIPAHAWSAQRFLTLEAFRRAGWNVLAMVNEPSAAGFEYTHRHAGTLNSKRTAILVYDLGGGTFDASIVSATGTLHEVMGSRGLNMVGGDDFDVVLATCLAAAADTDSGKLGDAAWERLIEDSRDAKETLSPSTKFITVPVDGKPVTIPVTDFYDAATPLVEATIAAMEPLLVPDAAGVGQLGGDIAGLYVVGGGSQLPLVARVLRSRFGRRVHRSPHTAASTAIGLAIGADPEAAYTVREQLSRGVGVFREREAGSFISFDTLLEPNTELAPGETLTIKRRYRAAHNIGYFRFVEYSSFDEAGVPRGDLQPYGEVIVPFDRALRRDDIDLSTVPVIRTEDGPLIEESYIVDENGMVTVEITDVESSFTVRRPLGRRYRRRRAFPITEIAVGARLSLAPTAIGKNDVSGRGELRTTTLGELINERELGALERKLRERSLNLAPHAANRNAEDALASLEQIDDFVRRGALVHGCTIAHQRNRGKIVHSPVLERGHGDAHLLKRNPCIEQLLDDLQHEDVAEGVQTLRAGTTSGAD